MSERRYRTCRVCGGTFAKVGFRRNGIKNGKQTRRTICRICEVTARTEAKHRIIDLETEYEAAILAIGRLDARQGR